MWRYEKLSMVTYCMQRIKTISMLEVLPAIALDCATVGDDKGSMTTLA